MNLQLLYISIIFQSLNLLARRTSNQYNAKHNVGKKYRSNLAEMGTCLILSAIVGYHMPLSQVNGIFINLTSGSPRLYHI